ncbi:hypothetical protein ZWY2020_002405 [Hordeum vulgare]|nr:hypothetical protein ZWY2020_002405 [Hordeum vulgare]
MIGEIGSKHTVFIPDMMPSLLDLLNDEMPAVARQAVKTGTNLFAKVLQELVVQGSSGPPMTGCCLNLDTWPFVRPSVRPRHYYPEPFRVLVACYCSTGCPEKIKWLPKGDHLRHIVILLSQS